MDADLQTVLRVINVVVYGGVTFAAWRLHRRLRTTHSAWLVLTFLTVAVVVAASLLLPPASPDESPALQLVRDVNLIVLLCFPFALYRFTAAFGRPPGWIEWFARAGLLAVAIVTLMMPALPVAGQPRSDAVNAYVISVLAYWTVLSLWVAHRLWRGGSGQPAVARRRMQMLASAAVVMNVALLLAGANNAPGSPLALITNVLVWLSAGLFLLGFAPPSGLRHAWRQDDERRLRQAEASLMSATTAEQVADLIVPHVATLLGGHGAALLDRQARPLAAQGFAERDLVDIRTAPEETITRSRLVLPLDAGWLVVQASPFAPFFSQDELDLLRSLGTFIDLALTRIELFDAEHETRQELQRTNEELKALVYGISHDLRSPIVTVIGYLELLMTDAADDLGPDARHYMERISVSARYMDSLIRDLLELSRIGRTQTEAAAVDLAELAADVATELQRHHPDASFDLGTLPAVRMNQVRARQLLTNLMENALRHGGRPDIRVSLSSDRPGDGSVVVTVADDGVGIPEQYRERVFGIFERLDGEVDASTLGTGIGLAMCRKIVEQVGGSIWIDHSDVGTTFRVSLPDATTTQSSKDVEVQRQ
ncbi:MAG TPA: ATP-binding protein [Egibacteraceae bacterium]|nr:ATP-binding protein [Egibacteraceae bacterium]